MKYLKHYWINTNTGAYACTENPIEKRHPEAEFPGLDVKAWMHDGDGIDVCLSSVPDSTTVADVNDESGKKAVKTLTATKFNSVMTPLGESHTLSFQAKQESDPDLKASLEAQATAKFEEAQTALLAL